MALRAVLVAAATAALTVAVTATAAGAQDEAQDGEERIVILSNEFSHLGVLLQDLFGTETMGLLFVGIHEICSL